MTPSEMIAKLEEYRAREKLEAQKQISPASFGGVLAGGGGAGGIGSITAKSVGRPHSLNTMLGMRMGWTPAAFALGFEHLAMHERGETVYVWVLDKQGQSVVIKDEAAMFPSDALVTKLRLMQQEK